MSKTWTLAVVLLIAVPLIGCETTYEKTMEPLLEAFPEHKLLIPAREKLTPGSTFKEDGQAVLSTNCYTGNKQDDRTLSEVNATFSYDTQAEFAAEWGKLLDLSLDFSKVGEVKLVATGLTQSAITDIRPTFSGDCLDGDGYTPDEPIFAALIKLASLEAKLIDKNGTKIDIKSDLSNVASFTNGLVPSGKLASTNDRNLAIKGQDLYVMYLPLRPKSLRTSKKALDCSVAKGLCDVGLGYYQVQIREIHTGGTGASIRVINPAIVPPMDMELRLDIGDSEFLVTEARRREYVQLRSVDVVKNSVQVQFLQTLFGFESAPLAIK